MGFPSGSVVKNLPAVQEPQDMWVQSVGQGNPLEEDMATHSSILAWITPWTEEPGGLQSMRSQRVRHDTAQHSYRHISQATVSMSALSTLFFI